MILEYQLSSASSHTNGGGSEVTFAASLTNSLVKSEWTFVTSQLLIFTSYMYEFSNLPNSQFSFDHVEFSSYWRMFSLQSGSSHSKHDVYVLRQTTVKISHLLPINNYMVTQNVSINTTNSRLSNINSRTTSMKYHQSNVNSHHINVSYRYIPKVSSPITCTNSRLINAKYRHTYSWPPNWLLYFYIFIFTEAPSCVDTQWLRQLH